VLGLSWQPEIDAGTRSATDAASMFSHLSEHLGFAFDVEYCPHGAGPPRCWCRKPLPGLGVLFIHRYKLDPAQCLYVGAGAQDPGFARKLGFTYRHASDFFGSATSRD
jgi:histidinol phosphatase-like enzyme